MLLPALGAARPVIRGGPKRAAGVAALLLIVALGAPGAAQSTGMACGSLEKAGWRASDVRATHLSCASARPGFKRCRPAPGVVRLAIGPRSRPCRAARSVARAWVRKHGCDPTGEAQHNCTVRLNRPWGCQADAFEFDPDSGQPYYVRCSRDFWHPMSGDPITAMVTFYW